MHYDIEFRPIARKELHALPRRDQLRVIRAIEKLADNPRPPGVKKLTSLENLHCIRAGDYRIIYQIHDDRLVVLVVRLGDRREVYR